MDTASPHHLLDRYPLIRSRDAADACARMGRVFSPHQLEVRGAADQLNVCHNQIRLREVSLNVLSYGTEVIIDPGERGDFYLVQLPLRGGARLQCGGREVEVGANVLSVLEPHMDSRMTWSADCSMVLLQVPREVALRRAAWDGASATPHFALSRSRLDPEVSAWWQAALDITANLDRFGDQWLSHPAAAVAMEEFLLSAFTSLLSNAPALTRVPERCLGLAKEYIHAHLQRALTLDEIARYACVSPRTLEAAFKRHGEEPPLAYARNTRLLAVHAALRKTRQDKRAAHVTEVALDHGFVHMGRFAAQYRQRFGCSPSDTLRAI